MSQLDPTLDLPLAAPPTRVHGRLRVPGWLVLLWRNRKSRVGILMVASMVVFALIAPLITVSHPNEFNLLATKQAPSWHHLMGTTDQGSDIFSQVALGARHSLLLGFAAALVATGLAATLGVTAAYAGGIVDEVINFFINVFPRHPGDPAPRRDLRLLEEPRMSTMVIVLAAVLWAFEARILRGQAALAEEQRLRPGGEVERRVDAPHRLRRADAEHDQPHRRRLRPRLLHRAARRRRASSSSGRAT
jgi:peptide/nickel transport system permease protein